MINKLFILLLATQTEDWGLTISGHAERHALLQAAELAPVPVHSVHHAVLLPGTLVVGHTGLGSPKEALQVNYYCGVSRGTLVMMTNLASLTRDHAVVDTAGLVSTHLAGDDLNLCCKKKELW